MCTTTRTCTCDPGVCVCVCLQEKDGKLGTLEEEVEELKKKEETLYSQIAECADVSSLACSLSLLTCTHTHHRIT